jgi:hypothetical protein
LCPGNNFFPGASFSAPLGIFVIFGLFFQGDRTKRVGIVDSEYIVHLGLPTLGASDGNTVSHPTLLSEELVGQKLLMPKSCLGSFLFGSNIFAADHSITSLINLVKIYTCDFVLMKTHNLGDQ